MALTGEQEAARLTALADLLTGLLPGGWKTVTLTYRAVGDTYEGVWVTDRSRPSLRLAAGDLVRSGAIDLLRRLRREMYDPERGAWLLMTFTVRSDDAEQPWKVSYTHADAFPWPKDVSPADGAAELAAFPRPEDNPVLEWLLRLRALHHAALSFDPAPILAAPQPEGALVERLGREDQRMFMLARVTLQRQAPEGVRRLLIGRLAEGCWSVVHAEPGWLAVHYDGGKCDTVRPFYRARGALAHAMARIMAEEEPAPNSEVLRGARVLETRVRPRDEEAAWLLGEEGRRLFLHHRQSPRPAVSAGEGPYIALDPIHNRPHGYFVCEPGAPPETGAFTSVHAIYERLALNALPEPTAPLTPVPERPGLPLREGTEVDVHGGPEHPFVHEVGTPFSMRGLWGAPGDHPYRVYRVVKPLVGSPARFRRWPFFPTARERAAEALHRPDEERSARYLAASVGELVRTGHLVELTGPGGDPVHPASSVNN